MLSHRDRRNALLRLFALLCTLILGGAQGGLAQAPAQKDEPRGRIAGRVVDAANGQPLAGVQISLGDRPLGTSDLDGHFTSPTLTAGSYSVRARRLGFQPKQYDSVKVVGGQTAVVNFTLTSSAVTLQSTVVSATRVDQAASEASLLAIQQRAAAATDGVSAEQIRRTPDGNAAAAAIRVSGVSVVEDKYVVVRGLEERYSNTLLNGVEVASPEPTKKIVPLDIFPSSLLESIVVTKSATPDKPGDFSGGSVEVRTKEFPDNPVRQFSISQSFNSITTGRALPLPQRRGTDIFGFDGSHRSPPPLPPLESWTDPFVVEKYAEGIRNQWTPATSRARPGLGLGLMLGGQRPSPRAPLGYVF
jgi:hypothetical protein